MLETATDDIIMVDQIHQFPGTHFTRKLDAAYKGIQSCSYMNTIRDMCIEGVLPLVKEYLKFLIETGGSSTRFILQRIADSLDPRIQN